MEITNTEVDSLIEEITQLGKKALTLTESSDGVVFKEEEYDGKKIIGHVELYDSGTYGQSKDDVNIAVEVSTNYRRQGIATKLIKKAIKWFKGSKYKTMSYIMDTTNVPSQKLAEKMGFAYITTQNNEHIYIITNPSLITESSKLDTIFYHGAAELYPKLAPISPNLGNRWESPKWVTYMWTNKENARKWAVHKVISKKIKALKQANLVKGLRSGLLDTETIKSFIIDKQYDEIKKIAVGLKCYIYIFKVAPESLGVGHSSSLDEYTSTDKHPQIIDIEEVKITPKLFDNVFIPITEKEYEKLKKELLDRPVFRKDELAGLMWDQQTIYDIEKYIKDRMTANEISPNDDIEKVVAQYVKENRISLR